MTLKTTTFACFTAIILLSTFMTVSLKAQPLSLTKEEMIQYSPLWQGERFPDGRPKVSDDIIKRMKYVTITEAWELVRRGSTGSGMRGRGGFGGAVPGAAMSGAGMRGGAQGAAMGGNARGGGAGMRGAMGGGGGSYDNQYIGTMKPMHKDVTICGRAMTAQFMPARPDINQAISQQGRQDNRSSGQYTWGIDMLQQGDVYVANVCEAILDASHVGDNLGTSIYHHSGNGAIIWGTLRDLEGNKSIEGFNVFVRDFRPQSNSNNMMMGLNCPLQLGYVTVMPGDVVLAKEMGIVFIPPHIAESVVIQSEQTRLRDTFAHIGVMEGRFTAQQADGGFTPAMNQEFTQWLKDNIDNIGKFFDDPNAAPSKEFIQQYIDGR
ncbi:MAG: RraA family protein [Sedimentisphaerales bacterium]|nr:RraA family protein [Sedimentisphaerales bacterium]